MSGLPEAVLYGKILMVCAKLETPYSLSVDDKGYHVSHTQNLLRHGAQFYGLTDNSIPGIITMCASSADPT
jgi:hypothetical protein